MGSMTKEEAIGHLKNLMEVYRRREDLARSMGKWLRGTREYANTGYAMTQLVDYANEEVEAACVVEALQVILGVKDE